MPKQTVIRWTPTASESPDRWKVVLYGDGRRLVGLGYRIDTFNSFGSDWRDLDGTPMKTPAFWSDIEHATIEDAPA